MTPTEFVSNRLAGLRALPPAQDFHDQNALMDFLAARLLSSKFRKYAVSDGCRTQVREAVAYAVERGEPVRVVIPFGGYKLWRLPESPDADWGELFSMCYYADWLKEIAASYAPGAWFDFYSDDVVVDLIDGVTRAELEAYAESFRGLLAFITPFLPANLRLTFHRVGDQYGSYEEFRNELAQLEAAEPSIEPSEAELATLRLNVRHEGPGEPDWAAIKRRHDAYMKASKRRPYYRAPGIVVASTVALTNTIPVGTSKSSVAKFWAGTGVLERRGASFSERILAPSNLERPFEWHGLAVPGLSGKNFSKIRIMAE